MSRKAAVSRDDLIASLKKFKNFSSEGHLLAQINDVWKNVSKDLNNKMSPKYIWQYLHEDRHTVQSAMREHFELPPLIKQQQSSEEEDHDQGTVNDQNTTERVLPKKTFIVKINPETWEKMKPAAHQYHRRDRHSQERTELRLAEDWKSVILEEFYSQHGLPCAYRLQGKVNQDPHLASCYVNISGKCPDCDGEGFGKIFVKPAPGEVVLLDWTATDSRNMPHSQKAQLRGSRRTDVGRECNLTSPSTFRRKEASKTMQLGSPESPLLSKPAALRKAGQNFRDKQLSVPKVDDEITTVENMKRTVPYAGSIHDIGSDRIFIPYDTPSQLLVYKTFRKAGYTRLTIDATGSLIERVARRVRDAGLSRHLFLYEFVLSGEGVQLPVAQLISERQDSDCLVYWIQDWLRRGGQPPHEVVSDASGAILAALSTSFAKTEDLKSYIEKQFLCLTGQSPKPSKCFIRKDVAHLTNNMAKWKAWTTDALKKVRQFYIRCFAVLVQSTTLKQFSDYLSCVLIISKAETIGTNSEGEPVSAEKCLRELSDAIASVETFSTETEDNVNGQDIVQLDDFDQLSDDNIPSCIKDFIENIKGDVSCKSIEEGDRVSPYKNDKIYEKFLEYANDFVLWTGVMVPFYKSPFKRPSSAASESKFSDLKCRILKGVRKPLLLHKMLQRHLDDIDGEMKLEVASIHTTTANASSTVPNTDVPTSSAEDGTPNREGEDQDSDVPNTDVPSTSAAPPTSNQSDVEDADTNNGFQEQLVENWRNLAGKGRVSRSKCKYFKPSSEARLAVEYDTLTPPTVRLLKSGSISGSCNLDDGTAIILKNTDIIDCILHLFAAVYIEFPTLRRSIDAEEDHKIFKCAKSLATVGAVKPTYVLRAKIALKYLKASDLQTFQAPATRKRGVTTSKVVECQGVLHEQCPVLLETLPSCIIKTSCINSALMHLNERDEIIVTPSVDTLQANGIESLSIACQDTLFKDESTRCSTSGCKSNIVTKCELNLFVMIDISSSIGKGKMKQEYKLNSIPDKIEIGSPRQEYRLIGLITNQPRNHYVCYVRNLQNLWQKYDNIRNGVISVAPEVQVRPLSLFYINTKDSS